MLKHWFAAHLDHRFGEVGGELEHAGTFSRREENGFFDLHHFTVENRSSCAPD
jgi:hypothetical protein